MLLLLDDCKQTDIFAVVFFKKQQQKKQTTFFSDGSQQYLFLRGITSMSGSILTLLTRSASRVIHINIYAVH